MAWSVEDTERSHTYQPDLRQRRPLHTVALGGLIIASLCISLLYLVGLGHITLDDGGLIATPPHPTVSVTTTDATVDGASSDKQEDETRKGNNDDDVILLSPEQHIYRKPTTIHFDWNITKERRSPDGVVKPIYLINGLFPGPLIEARSGDEVEVNVYNDIEENGHPGVAIHWHGLTMKDANEMDGVVGLTQCAIQSKTRFTYRFRIPDHQAGTFWYHAHSGVQRADGLYGGFVVHKPVQRGEEADLTLHRYEKEQLLLVGDWYHRSGNQVLDWFVDPDHYGMEPAPDSLLLNGRGGYNCSMAVKARPVECHRVEVPTIQLMDANRVRLRIINTGVSAGFSMEVSGGSMQPIAVDGGYRLHEDTPRARAIGLLHPGERVDVLLDRTESRSSQLRDVIPMRPTKMTIELDRENMPLVNFALKRIQSFSIEWNGAGNTEKTPAHGFAEKPVVDVFNLADAMGQSPPTDLGRSRGPLQHAVLYSTMKIRAAKHNQPVGSINHSSWTSPKPNTLPLLSLDRDEWAKAVPQPTKVHEFDVPWFKVSGPDEWIELTINNFDDKGYPFHLHGHEFYVVAREQATGTYRGYNPFDHESTSEARPFNLEKPLRKDTVHVPPMGYVVLRFPLNNNGLWLLHCHVLWHQAVGMGTVIQVGGDISEKVKEKSKSACQTGRGVRA